MPKRWLVKRKWFVVLEATTYTRIYGQQQFGEHIAGKLQVVWAKATVCKNIQKLRGASYTASGKKK